MIELANRDAQASSATKRPKAPAALWAAGVAVVLPAAIPIVHLLWVVLRPGGFYAGGFTGARLLDLAASTLRLTVAVTVTTLALGVATAWLTTRTDLRGARTWSTVMTLPLVIPSYVGALAMLSASGNGGTLTRLLEAVGLPGLPPLRGFWAAWAALSLWNFSFIHLLTVPVLRRLDPALEDVSRGLGAGRWRTLWRVVIPQLRPALASGGLLVALYVVAEFGAVSMLRYDTFTRTIYTQFAGRLDTGPALFLAGVLTSGALVLVVFQQMARGRAALHGNRPAREVAPVHLGRAGQAAGQTFLGLLAILSLVLPISTMVWWMIRGIQQGNSLLGIVPHTLRSIGISAAAALVVGVAAIPLGVLAARHRNSVVRVMEAVPWLTYSLPHLAVGLAFLVLTVRFARPLYQTTTLLVVVYLAMFLPQALAAVESGLRRVGPQLEEVSRSLGVGPWGTLRRVTIPMMRRSALAGAALVFLSVMKELPATLLLRPTGFDTLPVRIWSATNEVFYSQASFAALALVLVSAAPVYFFVVRDIHD
ncbi:MAG: iron ABC transporter permease [Actinomycetes bacterium]|nr:MAG: iron ABC transporter permease [Actinomycetota bacterium]